MVEEHYLLSLNVPVLGIHENTLNVVISIVKEIRKFISVIT
jgi:hypothetical protein